MVSSPVRDAMSAWVERGDVPGLAMLVAQNGEPDVDVIGAIAPGGAPMQAIIQPAVPRWEKRLTPLPKAQTPAIAQARYHLRQNSGETG